MALLNDAGFTAAAEAAWMCRNVTWALVCWERPALGLVDWLAIENAARSVR